jgi:GrpB-like predicted nucleotidyltransferase (UPF0157 family)
MPKPGKRNVLVLDYDPSWPLTFASLQTPIWESLRGIALSVEHVGSTSVPGLAAKPSIDMDIIVPSHAEMPATIERLAVLGYVHRGTSGSRTEKRSRVRPDCLRTICMLACKAVRL